MAGTRSGPTLSHTSLVAVPSFELARALDHANAYRQHTKANSTQAAYESDWARFRMWAEGVGAETLPASPAVVCAHLGWLADEGYSAATIERFLSAAGYFHKKVGLDFPRNARIVAETLEGVRRKIGVKAVKKAPLEIRLLTVICERLRAEADELAGVDLFANLQQRALLTVGWFCMLRSANLVSIQREHVRLVRFENDGGWVDDEERPDALVLHLLGSKTDQRKLGRDIPAHAQEVEAVCPVRTLAAYLRVGRFAPQDLIFPISERTVSRLIKRVVANQEHGHKTLLEIEDCELCSVSAHRFASHSLRRGAATTHARRGIPEREIMRQGGWKSERVMRGYIEYATIFENNPTKNLTGDGGGKRER